MQKNPAAVTQFQTTWPTVLMAQCTDHTPLDSLTVCAQAATRLGLLPVVRRRMTACGVHPVATVMHQCEHCYLAGAVAPTTGAPCFLALPYLNSRAFPCWWDGFAAAFAASLHIVLLDNGAGPKATAVRWPSHVVPGFLPP
jgi:hypothetical protein